MTSRAASNFLDVGAVGMSLFFVLSGFVLAHRYREGVGRRLPLYVGHNWLVLPVIFLVLVSLGSSRGLLIRLLSARPLVWAGRASYCFYSFQALLILPLIAYRERLVRLVPWLGNNRILALLGFVALLGVSGLAYHFIEEPLRRRIRRRYPALPQLARRAA